MASEPKLWAVFGPDGKPATLAYHDKRSAWGEYPLDWGISFERTVRKLRRLGYTCREVRIVPVEEVGK